MKILCVAVVIQVGLVVNVSTDKNSQAIVLVRQDRHVLVVIQHRSVFVHLIVGVLVVILD